MFEVKWHTLTEMLAYQAEHIGDRVMSRYFEKEVCVESLTFAESWALALRWAALLRDYGVGPGVPVIMALPNTSDFTGAYFGTLVVGGIPAPAAPLRRIDADDAYLHTIAERVEFIRAGVVVVPVDQAELAQTPPFNSLDVVVLTSADLPTSAGPSLARIGHPDELGLMQFTSGTSGKSKAVMLSHKALIEQERMISGGLDLDSPDVDSALSWLPLYHDMGLIGYMLSTVALGGTLNLMLTDDFIMRPVSWVRLLSETKATITGGPPSALAITARRIKQSEADGLDLSHLRVMLVGAEQVTEESIDQFYNQFEKAGLKRSALMPTYGMAENCLAVVMPPLGAEPQFDRLDLKALTNRQAVLSTATDSSARGFARLGVTLKGLSLRIVDPDDNVLGPMEVGEITLKSPSLMNGYFNQPEITATVLRDGWLYTGDLGYICEDGQLVMTGRKKEVIIVGGRNYYPDDIEALIAKLPGVRMGRAVAVSFHDPARGTEAIAVLAETSLTDPDARDMLTLQIRKVLAGAGYPISEVQLLAPKSIQSTQNGKLKRVEARERFLAGEFSY